MEHLSHIIRHTVGWGIDDIRTYYKNEYSCTVKYDEQYKLFCPVYHQIKTKFGKMGALATRGTVFALDDDGIFRGNVVCLPFFKFFNQHEEHAHQPQSDDDIVSIQRKADGSLIKVFYFKNNWFVATNGTAVADTQFIELFEKAINLKVADFDTIFSKHKTYLFELCTPENKIVVEYKIPHAKLLLTRCRYTFIELPNEPCVGHYDVIETVDGFDPSEIGEEGVVVVYRGGHRVKQKTHWYRTLHKTKSKSFDGYNWDSVVSAIHAGYYDDVLYMIPEKNRERAIKYMESVRKMDEHVEQMIYPYKLEKYDDKDKLVSDLKNGFFNNAIKEEWLKKLVLNVLFGKTKDIYVHATKPGKSDSLRKYIMSL